MSHNLKHAGHMKMLTSAIVCLGLFFEVTSVLASMRLWAQWQLGTAHVKHLQLGQCHEQQQVVALQVGTQPSKELCCSTFQRDANYDTICSGTTLA